MHIAYAHVITGSRNGLCARWGRMLPERLFLVTVHTRYYYYYYILTPDTSHCHNAKSSHTAAAAAAAAANRPLSGSGFPAVVMNTMSEEAVVRLR